MARIRVVRYVPPAAYHSLDQTRPDQPMDQIQVAQTVTVTLTPTQSQILTPRPAQVFVLPLLLCLTYPFCRFFRCPLFHFFLPNVVVVVVALASMLFLLVIVETKPMTR